MDGGPGDVVSLSAEHSSKGSNHRPVPTFGRVVAWPGRVIFRCGGEVRLASMDQAYAQMACSGAIRRPGVCGRSPSVRRIETLGREFRKLHGGGAWNIQVQVCRRIGSLTRSLLMAAASLNPDAGRVHRSRAPAFRQSVIVRTRIAPELWFASGLSVRSRWMEPCSTRLPRCRMTTCAQTRATTSNSCEQKSTTLPCAASSWMRVR